ncbi:MAG: hypothetical protein SOZ67_07570 [Alloprevotella sp.]|nr:hypothetical protein [Alloprevotella sp.]
MGLTAVHPSLRLSTPEREKTTTKERGDEKQVWRKTCAQIVTLAWQSEEICNLFVKKEVLFSKKSAQKFGGNPKVRTFAAF